MCDVHTVTRTAGTPRATAMAEVGLVLAGTEKGANMCTITCSRSPAAVRRLRGVAVAVRATAQAAVRAPADCIPFGPLDEEFTWPLLVRLFALH